MWRGCVCVGRIVFIHLLYYICLLGLQRLIHMSPGVTEVNTLSPGVTEVNTYVSWGYRG